MSNNKDETKNTEKTSKIFFFILKKCQTIKINLNHLHLKKKIKKKKIQKIKTLVLLFQEISL